MTLTGHKAEVFCCSWHPFDELLASGSGDSTVRLWKFPDTSPAHLSMKPPMPKVLGYVAPALLSKTSAMTDNDHDAELQRPSTLDYLKVICAVGYHLRMVC